MLAKAFMKRLWFDVNGCWEVTGWHDRDGYARFGNFDSGHEYVAHRYCYSVMVGPIPEGLDLDHLCRNTGCVNPAHLEPVTTRENIMRSPIALASINFRRTHCVNGHEFTPENTYRYDMGNGRERRSCRECSLTRWKKDPDKYRLQQKLSRRRARLGKKTVQRIVEAF